MDITGETPVSALSSNKRRISALKALGVVTVRDALTYYPFRVTDPVPLHVLHDARIGTPMAFVARVLSVRITPMSARRGYRLEALVDDGSAGRGGYGGGARARLVFFSHRRSYVDWMAMRLRDGVTVVAAGDPSEFNGQLQFTHPEILTVASVQDPAEAPVGRGGTAPDAATVEEALARVCRPRPIYHASSRISSEHIHETILAILRMLGAPLRDDAEGETSAAGAPTAGAAAPAADGTPSAPAPGTSGFAAAIPDILPEEVRVARGLLHRADAFLAIHAPESVRDFRLGIDTLRYEEAFVSQTSLLETRRRSDRADAPSCPPSDGTGLRDRFLASLPFDLTDGQRQVIGDIAADMSRPHPMRRLLQGEVGSGKTVVAVAAMLQAVDAGHQAVLVAPTQVLAEQHHATIVRMLAALDGESPDKSPDGSPGPSPRPSTVADGTSSDESPDESPATPVPVVLLTGSMRLAARRRAQATIGSGDPCIVVATHAAFSRTFRAPDLALAVIDEQHRFGVEQREALLARDDGTPHLLVMTATPIPRTAAMTWFGDLDVSWLTELPGGRRPVRTVVVHEENGPTMGRMFAHIRARIDRGERAYIVCARIDETEDGTSGRTAGGRTGGKAADRSRANADVDVEAELDPYADADADAGAEGQERRPPLHTVAQIAQRLQRLPQFAGIRFATLTGRDRDEDKRRIMEGFAAGDTPVLVATTVIEVGVDVPQASCIVIFDADRYGLSQLHQLRGRVGRGGTDAWAFLVSRAEPGSPAERRLEVIRSSDDGAAIAQADLEFRGAGDVLGDAQSGGRSSLKLLRVVKDADLIADARSRASGLLAKDPDLAGHVALAGAVLDFTRGNEAYLTSS